jgi:alkanesulfonate monooxygenase SsuD/methylene tetrahydromethanopterin reductase-like flavin-dependent oxidoreductase (luciferase family)
VRQLYVASDKAEAETARNRAAAHTQRTVDVSRAPDGKGGSHVLSYADTAGATEAHALFGTPDEICEKLEALRGAGVEYILLTILGDKEQLRRFAREVMPGFAGERTRHNAGTASEPTPA